MGLFATSIDRFEPDARTRWLKKEFTQAKSMMVWLWAVRLP